MKSTSPFTDSTEREESRMKSKKQIEEEVKNEIAKIKPYVKDLVSATRRFDESANVVTGARRYDAKERLFKTIASIAQVISYNWLTEYNETITKDEMDEIFKAAFDSVTFDEPAEYECYRNIICVSNIGEGI